jgi:hypothetical protein
MKTRRSPSHVRILWFLLALAVVITGCDYRHYGVRRDAESLTFPQTDPYYITGKYEFQSVLFKSPDDTLIVHLQHPIHPIPTPDIFISQIGFELADPEPQILVVHEATLEHFDATGAKVRPDTTQTIPDRVTQEPRFYVNTYSKSALTKTLTEVVTVRFQYRGEPYEIQFREEVRLVKRWNKVMLLLNS